MEKIFGKAMRLHLIGSQSTRKAWRKSNKHTLSSTEEPAAGHLCRGLEAGSNAIRRGA